ncbi:hypothetical protein B1F79_05330 [Coxiella-like endosymbiont of Rhipicephalus sanguineus]|nr:hypothetical protein [Coxiella-like endosymbiont of Rhipicephalus sanguineus]
MRIIVKDPLPGYSFDYNSFTLNENNLDDSRIKEENIIRAVYYSPSCFVDDKNTFQYQKKEHNKVLYIKKRVKK